MKIGKWFDPISQKWIEPKPEPEEEPVLLGSFIESIYEWGLMPPH